MRGPSKAFSQCTEDSNLPVLQQPAANPPALAKRECDLWAMQNNSTKLLQKEREEFKPMAFEVEISQIDGSSKTNP